MDEYIGLDVSLEETAISIRRDGQRIWRGKCKSDPNVISALVQKRAPGAKRMVFETGPLSVWFYHALSAEGLPAICIDARHAKAVLNMAANKTDANDADGLAQLAEVVFYHEVRVKGYPRHPLAGRHAPPNEKGPAGPKASAPSRRRRRGRSTPNSRAARSPPFSPFRASSLHGRRPSSTGAVGDPQRSDREDLQGMDTVPDVLYMFLC